MDVTRASFQEEEIPWKKTKFELLSKHSSVDIDQTREIQQYRCLSVPTDDPLKWWSTQSSTYKHLSQLARYILPIPATSAPSERIFSLAGVLVNAKRSALAPTVVDKVIFVHENSKYLEWDSCRYYVDVESAQIFACIVMNFYFSYNYKQQW